MSEVEEEKAAPPPVEKAEENSGALEDNSKLQSSSILHQKSAQDKMAAYKASAANFEEDEKPDLPPISPYSRKCTDVLCLLVFVCYWIAQIGVAGFGFLNGNPKLLIYGTDNQGNLCGDGNSSSKEFLALPRLTLDIEQALADGDITDLKLFGICVEKCPSETDLICSDAAEEILADEAGDRDDLISQCISGDAGCVSPTVANECFITVFNTTSFLFRCLPEFIFKLETLEDESGCTLSQNFTNSNGVVEEKCLRFRTVQKSTVEEPPDSNFLSNTFNTVGRQVEQVVSDLLQTLDVIGYVGLVFSLFISILYVSLLWLIVAPIVWGTLIMIIVLSVAFTVYLYAKAGLLTTDGIADLIDNFDNTLLNASSGNVDLGLSNVDLGTLEDTFPTVDDNFQETYRTAAYVATGVSALVFLIILCLFPKISKAITIFNEASHTLRANIGLIFMPPLVAVAVLLNALFFLASLAFTQTIGEIEIKELNFSVDLDEQLNSNMTGSAFVPISGATAVGLFLFFGFLWSTQFVMGLSTMIISHTVAQSYWDTAPGSISYKSGSIMRAFRETLKFHMGTAAFGGLLIAFVQFVRYMAMFLDSRTKQLQDNNKIIKYIMKSVHCFLYCAEKCVKFVSRNAYIMTSMYGTNFCRSSTKAFFAIASNLAQVGTVSFLGTVILTFGKVLITILTGFVAAVALDQEISAGATAQISSAMPAILIVMLLAWMISSAVLNIYDVTVDTLLLSYCQDKKRLKMRGEGQDDLAVGKEKNIHDDLRGKKSFKNLIHDNSEDEEKLLSQKKLFTF